MSAYAGLDVSLNDTSVCVVNGEGGLVLECKVGSEPDAIAKALQPHSTNLRRVGIEASALGGWLQRELAARGFEAIVIEARHTHVALSSMRNKTDRNDARGIAQLMRLGWYKVVHVKSPEAQRLRMLLGCRQLVSRKLVDVENEIRGTLRAFGLKVGKVSRRRFAARVLTLAEQAGALIEEVLQRMLAIRETLLIEYRRLHQLVIKATVTDPVCRRLMTVPGVGPLGALAFRCGVDDPHRFKRSRTVAAHFGMTPRRHQSGEVDYTGRISNCGDREVRQALYNAAGSLLRRYRKPCPLRTWGLRISKRSGIKKATVAVSRKMAVIMHRMWLDGTDFRCSKDPGAAAATLSAGV
jgi:transposase